MTTLLLRHLGSLIILLTLCLVGPASAQQVKFPGAVLPGITAPAMITATISKPEGSGPFPAVIVLHDCGGVSSKDRDWAKRLAGWGYVAVLPDSFGSRGHGNLCTDVEKVGAQQRVQDVIGARRVPCRPALRAERQNRCAWLLTEAGPS